MMDPPPSSNVLKKMMVHHEPKLDALDLVPLLEMDIYPLFYFIMIYKKHRLFIG